MSTNNLPPTPPPRAYANSTQPPKPPPKLSSLLYGKGVNGNSVTSPPTTTENNENTSPPSSSSPSTTTEADIDNTNDSSTDQQVLDSNQTDIIVESEDKVTLSIDSPNNLHSRITSDDNLENFANKFAMNSLNTLGSVSDSHFRKRSTSDMDATDSSSSPTLHESISSNGSINVNSNSLDSPIIPRLDLEETLQSPTIINFDDDETTESSSAMDDDEASTVTTPKATIDKDKAISILGEHIPQLLTRVRFFNFIRRDPSLKKARKRQELIKETIETEKTYVQNLKSFLNLYYQPLIENRDHGKGVLKSQSELQVLFANINQISNINQTLLSDLEKANPETKIEIKEESLPSPTSSTSSQVSANSTSTPNGSGDLTSPRTVGFVIKRKDDPNLAKKNQPSSYRIYDSIGKPFGHLVPFLKVYTTYINNHDRATEMFEKMKKSNKKFKEFLTECYQMQKGIKSDFCSFLILPIQRIPRYKMLLSEILTNTPEEHAEFENLQKVVNEIEKIASYINEQKRNFDNVRYMYEIYNMIEPIYPGFVQPNRKFLRKASFHVKYRQVKAQRNSTALPTPPINTNDSKNSGSMTPRSLPSVPPKNPSATTAPPVLTSGGKRVLPPPVPGKQPDSFSNVLAQMTGSNKLLNLKALYNEGRFTIYQFTDMLVLIEEKNEADESSSGLSAFQSFTRKATMFGKKKEQSTPTNSDSTKSKYHQLTLTVGKNLHFIFFHFIDNDAFFGNSNNSNVVTTSGGKSLPVPPPKRGFYDVIDECDIPIRVITKGSQYEYILTTSTTGDRDEWKESLGNCISDICNVKIYANRGVSLQNSSEMYKLGKERAAVHTQAKENLKFHQQIQQEHMLLQVRTVQVSSEIQQKKELLATLQREIAELEQEKQDKEKRLEVIKEEKGQVREKITTLWQDLQQKDKTALKLLHEEKEAFKHVFGCEFGEELSFKAPSSSTSTSGSGSTATNNSNEKNNNSPLAPGQVNSDLMEQLMKVKANAEANKNPQVSEKKSSLLKSIIGDSKSRKVTIKHTQFIENQLKAVHSPSNKTIEPNNTSESTPTKN